MINKITEKLIEAFAPEHIEVVDESHQHIGHAGYREGGNTHFRVVMNASSLAGQSRVEQQRSIYKVLAPEFARGLHALALEVSSTP